MTDKHTPRNHPHILSLIAPPRDEHASRKRAIIGAILANWSSARLASGAAWPMMAKVGVHIEDRMNQVDQTVPLAPEGWRHVS